MIVVTISMWPKGDQSKAVEIGRATLTNMQNTTLATRGKKGDYLVEFRGGVHGRAEITSRLWKRGVVKDFDRQRRGAWDLLYLALKKALGGRNED